MSVECFSHEKENETIDHLPEGSVLIQTLNDIRADLHALCPFNLGSTNTLINHFVVPPEIPVRVGASQSFTTTIVFPDFCKSWTIPKVQFRLFHAPNSRYNVIINHDVLKHGFVLDHARNTVT